VNPKALEKVQAEVDSAMAGNSTFPDSSTLAKLPYLTNCFKVKSAPSFLGCDLKRVIRKILGSN